MPIKKDPPPETAGIKWHEAMFICAITIIVGAYVCDVKHSIPALKATQAVCQFQFFFCSALGPATHAHMDAARELRCAIEVVSRVRKVALPSPPSQLPRRCTQYRVVTRSTAKHK